MFTAVSFHMRGVSRSSDTRDEMRWTRQRQACDGSQGGGRYAKRERIPRKLDDGAEAYGENVWSWHPKLVSSLRRMRSAQPGRTNLNPKATVATELSCRGERVINRKTIVWGMPDDPVPRCYSCASAVFFAREAAGASGHRGIPRALFISRARRSAKARAHRAAGRLRASATGSIDPIGIAREKYKPGTRLTLRALLALY